ncbi:MAG TPA: TOBE domain-containing protein [Candidatus Eisenbacteria bacterium]|nr:TOBE domain-containing protein [Candidatus Eisenbacteria bacterium]
MQTLTVSEAADLLHMNAKRVQSLAREGKLPAVRVGRRWLFRRDQIESLLGCPVPATAPALSISARNRLRGTITALNVEGLMAEVQVRIGDQELVSVITRSSAERLRLREGDTVYAVIKSTEVIIGKGDDGS